MSTTKCYSYVLLTSGGRCNILESAHRCPPGIMVFAMKRRANVFRRWQWRASILCLGVMGVLFILKLHGVMLREIEEEVTLPTTHSSSRPKLAFLFLTRNRMPLDFLWDHFFQVSSLVFPCALFAKCLLLSNLMSNSPAVQGAERPDYSIYVHARPGVVLGKSTTNSRFFYDRQINNSILVWPSQQRFQLHVHSSYVEADDN